MTRAALGQVVLEGATVRLEPLGDEHVDAIARVAKAEYFALFSIGSLAAHDQASARALVDEATAGWRAGTYLPFAIIERASGELLGSTRLGDIDLESGRVEIGWTWLVPQARGTLVNTECKLLLLTHAFDTLGVRRVAFKTSHANTRSQRAIERLGAVREGVLRQHTRHHDGSNRDTVYYAILAEEWPAVRERLQQRLRGA